MRGAERFAFISLAVVGMSTFGFGTASAAVEPYIDFEGLTEGKVVASLFSGSGIAGDPIAGSVRVFGDHRHTDVTKNAAIAYDATCRGGGPAACSGGEDDKFKPALGTVLTIARSIADANSDGVVDAPDTSGGGGKLRFDFSGFGDGAVTIASLDVLDAENGGRIDLFARGKLIGTMPFAPTANNGVATVAVGSPVIDRMEVTLRDSGVIDNIRLALAPPPPRIVCRSLRLSVRTLALGRRSAVRATVRGTDGATMSKIRVVARAAGVRASGVTNERGVARFLVRPRRAGVVRFAVPGSSSCVRQVRVRRAVQPVSAGQIAG